jgi:polyphosphate kinase
VENPALANEIRSILDIHLHDRRSAWDMQPDGSYVQRHPVDTDVTGSSHSQLIEQADKRVVQYRKRMKKKGAKTETHIHN